MNYLNVSSIQRGSVHDGIGMRTTVFLKGCRLKCPWCCNPETSLTDKAFINYIECQNCKKKFHKICDECELSSGNRSKIECPFLLVSPTFRKYTISEVYQILIKDFELFEISGGGVTFSGGEPLLQADALVPLMKLLKARSINIAVETSLFIPESNLTLLSPYIDEFIIDLKLQPEMFLNSEKYLSLINSRIRKIGTAKKNFRIVFIDKLIDFESEIANKLNILSVKHIELLKCHNMAENKYEKLNLSFTHFEATLEKMKLFQKELKTHHISSEILF